MLNVLINNKKTKLISTKRFLLLVLNVAKFKFG